MRWSLPPGLPEGEYWPGCCNLCLMLACADNPTFGLPLVDVGPVAIHWIIDGEGLGPLQPKVW
jgi:hypothetical protein